MNPMLNNVDLIRQTPKTLCDKNVQAKGKMVSLAVRW